MTEIDDQRARENLPTPRLQNRSWIPRLIWLVPIAAAVVGVSLLIKTVQASGPKITISFQTAEGIEVGKTLVKYLNVTIGRVSQVALSGDGKTVLVSADLNRSGAGIAKVDSAFWVVKPRFGVGWVSGLDTLLSGSFIGVQVGSSREPRLHFVGLEAPPALAHGPSGKLIQLRANSAGSVNIGAPVYFHQFQVGRVVDLSLSADGHTQITLFIDAPNDRFVTSRTRFWNSSGIDMKVGADGISVKTESAAAVLAGGIAFGTGPDLAVAEPILTLFKNEEEAMAKPRGEPHYMKLVFAQAVPGLEVDASLKFMGITVGSVVSIDLGYEPRDKSFPVIVNAKIYPALLGQAYLAIVKQLVQQGSTENDDTLAVFVGELVERGLRAQPRSSSLLSGHPYIALDFAPSSSKVNFDPRARPLELPTLPSNSNEIENRLSHIAKTLDELPLHNIANQWSTDLQDLHGTLELVKGQLIPEGNRTLRSLRDTVDTLDRTIADESPLRERVDGTLTEAQRTLSSVRNLVDFLDRHPEALIRGRKAAPSTGQSDDAGSRPR